MSKKQIKYSEPADRPIMIGLSHGEMLALIKHHEKSAKTVERAAVKAMGEWQLKSNPSKRDLNAITKKAQVMMNAYFKRAKGLSALLHDSLEKTSAPSANSAVNPTDA